MKIAEGFVIYEGRNSISSRDIIIALKAQALDHSHVWDKDETQTRVQDAFNDILCDLEKPADELSESDDGQENVESRPKLEEEAYQALLTTEERWESWEPSEFPYTVLKTAIDNTAQAFEDGDIGSSDEGSDGSSDES